MGAYNGEADILAHGGELLDHVTVRLVSVPPTDVRFGTWRGTVNAVPPAPLNDRINLGDVIVRLRDGRIGRAIIKRMPMGPAASAELVGSGPPPF